MRLTDLHPYFMGAGGDGVSQHVSDPPYGHDGFEASGRPQNCPESHWEPAPVRYGVGVCFDCPCGDHDEGHRCYVPFSNPLDGGPALDRHGWNGSGGWQRTGETVETLTLTPSILRSRATGGCGWHGFITNGEVTGQVEG